MQNWEAIHTLNIGYLFFSCKLFTVFYTYLLQVNMELIYCFFSYFCSYVLELIVENELEVPFYKICLIMAIWLLLYVKKEWYRSSFKGHVRKVGLITFVKITELKCISNLIHNDDDLFSRNISSCK